MDEQEINKMYECLPKDSKGREADNPEMFRKFLDATESWPFVILCEDQKKRNLTWHIACDEYPLDMWIEDNAGKIVFEMRASMDRGRILEFKEVYTRKGDHYFLKQ